MLGNWKSFEIQNQESFKFAREISKSYGDLDNILSWAKNELVDEWRWQLVSTSTDRNPGRYVFYFNSERDAVAFALMWS